MLDILIVADPVEATTTTTTGSSLNTTQYLVPHLPIVQLFIQDHHSNSSNQQQELLLPQLPTIANTAELMLLTQILLLVSQPQVGLSAHPSSTLILICLVLVVGSSSFSFSVASTHNHHPISEVAMSTHQPPFSVLLSGNDCCSAPLSIVEIGHGVQKPMSELCREHGTDSGLLRPVPTRNHTCPISSPVLTRNRSTAAATSHTFLHHFQFTTRDIPITGEISLGFCLHMAIGRKFWSPYALG